MCSFEKCRKESCQSAFQSLENCSGIQCHWLWLVGLCPSAQPCQLRPSASWIKPLGFHTEEKQQNYWGSRWVKGLLPNFLALFFCHGSVLAWPHGWNRGRANQKTCCNDRLWNDFFSCETCNDDNIDTHDKKMWHQGKWIALEVACQITIPATKRHKMLTASITLLDSEQPLGFLSFFCPTALW